MSELTDTEDALLAALKTIRDNWAGLLDPGTGGGSEGPKSSDAVTPTDRRVSLSHEVTLCLEGWARVIVDDNNLSHSLPLGTDTLGLVTLIERWARWFSGHAAVHDALAEIEPLAEQVRVAVTPPRRDWVAIGACPMEVEREAVLQVCGGQVRAKVPADPACQRCGTTGDPLWWQRVIFNNPELSDLVTGPGLAEGVRRAFGGEAVKPGTIRQWINRGTIRVADYNEDGQRLYSMSEAIHSLSRRGGSGQTAPS